MPFIPHTEQDVKEMLDTIGIKHIEELFDEIPSSLKLDGLNQMSSGMSEMALTKFIQKRAEQDANLLCFLGAGAYEHFIPAAVWEITSRGEFMTAYTPYQAEASQGGLQLLYEYQTMMCRLMAHDVSNASLYDGASALAEAVLMSVRLHTNKNARKILVPKTVHPHYFETLRTIVSQQNIELIEVPYDSQTGKINLQTLNDYPSEQIAALIIPQPNFFGILEDVDAMTAWALKHHIYSIALVNPLSMALLKPPGEWGDTGVDIACGEGQPLGIPLASGGPYFGFLTCKKMLVRQMPGRIVGRTIDLNHKPGFVLTLQAREQHIRRGKATSNICTNQGLMVTAATIYMSLLGPKGLQQVAKQSHQQTQLLANTLLTLPGVKKVFNSPFFHEIVLKFDHPVDIILHELAKQNIQAGVSLQPYFPELNNCLLLCATETKSNADIQTFASNLAVLLQGDKLACHG